MGETLKSAAAQTYSDLEIIIVDDGSTDSTCDIARQFCESEPRARLIAQANGGVASARNRGIAESKGEWIAPLDSDDLWHPTRIEKMVAAALAAPEKPGFVYCWCRNIDREGVIITTGPRLAVEGRAFTQLAFVNAVGNGSGLLASREALLEIGGYDPSLRAERAQGAEDMLVQLLIAWRHPVALVPEHLVGWRRTGETMSSDIEQMNRSIRLVYHRLAQQGMPVSSRVQRGMVGMSAFDLVESYAAKGSAIKAIGWLVRSLRLDPVRFGLLTAYRLARTVRRRFGPAPSVRQPVHFLAANPGEWIGGDPYRLNRFANFLETIEQQRLESLARKDKARHPAPPHVRQLRVPQP